MQSSNQAETCGQICYINSHASFLPSHLYRPNAHFIRSHILSITITTTCTSMFIIVGVFTTKALPFPLPGKVLHTHLATFDLAVLRTMTPSIHLERQSPVQVFVFITVKYIRDVILDDIPIFKVLYKLYYAQSLYSPTKISC